MYSEWGRTRFLEALAEAYSGDLSRLAGTAYDYVRVNPDTLEPDPVPWFSDAIYFLTGCADFAYFEGTPEARGESYLRQGDRIDAALPHMNAIYYDNLPCAFWPFHPAEALPTLVDPPFPVLILGATADPATPLPMGEAVFRRLEDAYLVVVEGGPHIVFRTNDACVDAIVTDLLVSGLLPPDRETHCSGRVIDSYEP
jgi:pimeloyl-ACP methyl ester carboxylesterase